MITVPQISFHGSNKAILKDIFLNNKSKSDAYKTPLP